MTREQAIQIAAANFRSEKTDREIVDFVDVLHALGVLELTAIDDETFRAAADRLGGTAIEFKPWRGDTGTTRQISAAGAHTIMDVLRRSGFKVTR